MPERLYGIRHHGPGSARGVVQELDRQRPDIVLIEGPPEADELVRWVADEGLQPPVALLGYAADNPARAAFWPFAVFSPEWQAMRWAVRHGVPVRFFDLPYAYRLTDDRTPDTPPSAGPPTAALPSAETAPTGSPSGTNPAASPAAPPVVAGTPTAATAPAGLPSVSTVSPGPSPSATIAPGGPPSATTSPPGSSSGSSPTVGSPAAHPPAETPARALGGEGAEHQNVEVGYVPADACSDSAPKSLVDRSGARSATPASADEPALVGEPPLVGEPTPGTEPTPAGGQASAGGPPTPPAVGQPATQPTRPTTTPETSSAPPDDTQPAMRHRPVDPIGELAAAAGYDDPERWWEDVVEHRGMPAFEAIAEAMTAIRENAPDDPDDLVREAYMRTVLREVRRTHDNIAVVCGAWHVPALARKVTAREDAAVLKGRKRAKVAFTWVPWTYGRLASWSGYGAGVRSPGWYHHLFTTGADVVPRWLVDAAQVLRAEGVPTSSAHVIEATRLAEALAGVRGRPLAGLAEVTEAAEAVMCDGEPLRVELIGRRLVVGERLGAVPDAMPAVPLARDLAAQQRSVRLKPEALERVLDLDLRRDIDLGRSRLLHRLRAIGVPWGEADTARRGTGTFREQWRLRWQPDFAVQLVEGSMYGTTVVAAATTKVTDAARQAASLGAVTALVEVCLLADLADAYPPVLAALDTRAALDADIGHLMAAIPALAHTLRYGDVRRTDVAGLSAVTASLLTRVCAGLPAAGGSLSDEAAQDLRGHLDGVHAAVSLLDDEELRDRWLTTLESLSRRADLHGLLAGRLTRLLLDAGRLGIAEVQRRLRLPLTVGTPPAHGAAWVEGFLAGGGLLLVHDDALLELLDGWLADIPADAFGDVLPLLRRTFGAFAAGERRAIGERVAGRAGAGRAAAGPLVLDHDRAALVLPTLSALLGREVS
ncbi:hypothetical protein GCM10020358_08000 [Amorphoplanes nipponensis]|uniref:Uncharacterized protein n=1 Tax=Actinoplanes nipponensis TaxID=135950 RepID=A0A919JBQ8_9ACTN|nr:DUF5682 family protein [Actinoplanes nipponensis]GIE48044.1 hypothetical protein Ani05nite_15780 [Actinoplanes nipponensis]